MPSRCTVCSHPQRGEIEAGSLQGQSERVVANQYGVSKASVHRHLGHIAADLEAARVRGLIKRTRDPDRILRENHAHTRRILKRMAERGEGGDLDAEDIALKALKHQRELLAFEFPPLKRVEVSEAVRKLTPEQVEAELEAAIAELRRRKGEG